MPGRRPPQRIALFHTDGPSAGLRFNKGEYIRVIPPGSPEHHSFYGIRNDTESLHNEIKRRRIRLPRDSVAGQELRLLGYMIGQNPSPTPRGVAATTNPTPWTTPRSHTQPDANPFAEPG